MTTPPQYPSAPEPGYPGGMPPYAGGQMPQQPPRRGLTIAGLVLGILSVPLFFTGPVAIILGILAIVFSSIGLARARRAGISKKMAVWGLVLGIIGVLLGAAATARAVKAASDCNNEHPGYSNSQLRDCINDKLR